jgi:hypothetical protein
MATTDPTALAADANCLNCIPPGLQLPVLIWLFAQIAGVTTDPTTLAANANCLACIPPGMQWPVLIWLATQIAGGTTGGSSLQFTQSGQTMVTNTVVETSMVGAGVGSMTIPASTLKAGSVILLQAFCILQGKTSAAPMIPHFQMKANGVVIANQVLSKGVLFINPGDIASFIITAQIDCVSLDNILGNITVNSPGYCGACSEETATTPMSFAVPQTLDLTMQANNADVWAAVTQNLQVTILQPRP